MRAPGQERGAIARIAVVGAGAVGGHIAARLARAGLAVSVVARGEHLAAIRRQGLRLIAGHDDFTVAVAASDDPADLGPQDLVVSTLKAHMLPDAAGLFAPLLAPATPVVFAVNGIPWWYFHGVATDAARRLPRLDPGGRLWRDIGPHRVLGCVIRSPNERVAPGVIRNNVQTNRFAIGEPDGRASARLAEVMAVLHRGLPGAVATGEIRTEIWRKLLVNVPSSLLSGLTLATSPDLFADPATRALYEQLGTEVGRVAAAQGVPVGFDLDAQIAATGSRRHPPSMLQDLLAGLPLEFDAQIGAVQDLARQAGVATPVLDVAAALLARRAAMRQG